MSLRTLVKMAACQRSRQLERRFMGFIRRMEPLIPQYFSVLPKPPYGVKRLDPADEPGMTYGYYQPPTPGSPTGLYRYNGSDLAERSLVGAQHLIYHELIPGHHYQIALQREMTPVHPLQTHFSSNAFSEGWAEYGASMAEDTGLYEGYDLCGRLLMQSHLAARLVLDTGLNELGWSLERAREYLGDHSLQSLILIGTEEMCNMVARPENRSFHQCVTFSHMLRAFSHDETKQYFEFHLDRSEGPKDLFSQGAVRMEGCDSPRT